jgi:hypothetical protein
MLMASTKARGPIMTKGLRLERRGTAWRKAVSRKMTLESLVNCRSRDLGRKVSRLYLVVSI